MRHGKEINFKLKDERLSQGIRLADLADFPDKVRNLDGVNGALRMGY
jgi:hypothetical protein